MRVLVTTTHGAGEDAAAAGQALAVRLDVPFVPRGGHGLATLLSREGAEAALVFGPQRLSLCFYRDGRREEFFFHPGTALLRIKNILAGKPDQMIQAMALRPGDTVLDCTLGLGADAIVASFVAGSQGRVVGVEKVAPLAAVVEYGLRHYAAEPLLTAAMRRIEVVVADHYDYLLRLPAASFDVVYFDPFFRVPVKGAAQVAPLRAVGERAPLKEEAVQAALRVARRRVVLKERRGSAAFTRLGFREFCGGRHAHIAYGVREK
ncbi:class I SAM-dependent methyltransferase [Thermodesulfitimonas sp.]